VAANTSTNSRTGTLTIAGHTFTVGQAGIACKFVISPLSRVHGPGEETGTVSVTTDTGCSWAATSNAIWIAIEYPGGGVGSGSVSYSVSANSGTSTRTGKLTVAGLTFTVTQTGVACTYSISPTGRTHGSGAETGTISISAQAGCNWTAVSDVSWVSITSGGSGAGNGAVSYSTGANFSPAARTGTMRIAGQSFTIVQSGAAAPVIADLNPAQVNAGGAAFKLTVSGLNFAAGSAVRWNGVSRTTTFLGVSQLQASIPASDIGPAGVAQVTVANPSGSISAPKQVQVSQQNPLPSVSILSPAYMPSGGPGF
jgi:hypothetical protein